MKAMIFAAGLGTRMGSLTADKPKALVEVNHKPMLEHVVEYLKSYEVRDIIINVHHFGGLIKDYLRQQQNFGINIEISDESEELLDTGGGLMKAAHFFNDDEPFIAHNVDVLSDTNLYGLINKHRNEVSIATLVVKKRESSRYFLLDEYGHVRGWLNEKTGQKIIKYPMDNPVKVAFSGIQMIRPLIFHQSRLRGKFSITDLYIDKASELCIATYIDEGKWFDLGTPENIKEAELKFFNK
jgi:N-acetyl-alpha-D-muramate 1-phosphate uridylyltransferase